MSAGLTRSLLTDACMLSGRFMGSEAAFLDGVEAALEDRRDFFLGGIMAPEKRENARRLTSLWAIWVVLEARS